MQHGISIDGKDLLVRPPKYPSQEVKEELGGRWDKQEKAWRVTPTSLNVILLAEWYGAEFIGTAPEVVQNLFRLDWGFKGFESFPDLKQRAESHPQWSTLYSFQKIAVEYLCCNPHKGALLALSPGLGKTVVSIVAMDVIQAERILILAPLTLAKNWGKEIDKWSRGYRSWTRATAIDKNPVSEVTITNFETVFYTVVRDEEGNVFNPEDDSWVKNPRRVKEWIESGPKETNPKTGKKAWARKRITQARPAYITKDWDLIIVDESILLKNRKAVRVDIVAQLAKYAHNIWLLSGSPTAKFQDDLYPQVKTIMPRGFTSYWRFAQFFCVVEKGQWGWSIVADRPNRDPKHYLRDFMLVMNQKDVLPELPDYLYDPIDIDLKGDQQKAFDQMVHDWIVQLEDEDEDPDLLASNRLAQQTRMLQITSNLCNLEKGAGKKMPSSSAKEDLLVDLIKNQSIEFPLLVWCWWVPTSWSIMERIESEFPHLCVRTVTGELKAEDKDKYLEEYKDNRVDVLILQTNVGKFGHNLTNTKTVFYHDRYFDADAYVQSLRRVRRIGLEHVPRLIVPRAQFSADPLVELNLSGKLQSIAKVASHDLKELLMSLGNIPWSI